MAAHRTARGSFGNQAEGARGSGRTPGESQQPRQRGAWAGSRGEPCSPAASAGPARYRRFRRKSSPLELAAPQDAAVGELDDGRVRDGFVGRHGGAGGAPGSGVSGSGRGAAAAGSGRAAAPAASGCRGSE